MMATGPTRHLSWAELACHDRLRSQYPLDWRDARGPILGRAFEDLREECALAVGQEVPLIVLEGYRTPAYQAYLRSIPRYHAALHSQHCEGRAIDVACPIRYLDFDAFVACAKRASAREDSPIRYLEFRPSMLYIHVDARPTASLVMETIP